MSKYAVIDLEMCKVPRGIKHNQYPCKMEIIQIGAVLLDESFEIVDRFNTLVSPQYGTVDSFIRRLTGISREDTLSAPSIEDALELFAVWLPEDTVLVAWSENDEGQLRRETVAKDIHIPEIDAALDTFVDCQQLFGEKMKSEKVYRLSEALRIADIDFEDGAHDALVDAVNTALLFAKLQNEDELCLNEYYHTEEESGQHSCNPFAALFGDFAVAG